MRVERFETIVIGGGHERRGELDGVFTRKRWLVDIGHLDEMPRDPMIRRQSDGPVRAPGAVRITLRLGKRIPPCPAHHDTTTRRIRPSADIGDCCVERVKSVSHTTRLPAMPACYFG